MTKLVSNGKCSLACSTSEGKIPRRTWTFIHEQLEKDIAPANIVKTLLNLKYEKVPGERALRRHRERHLSVAPEAESKAADKVIGARPSRQEILESILYDPRTAPDLKVKIIQVLDARDGGEGFFQAMFDAMSGESGPDDDELEDAATAALPETPFSALGIDGE